MKTKRYAKPKEEWVINQSEELRLIADDVWETAQKNRMQNQRAGFGFGPKRAAYLLTGLFNCGTCGNSVGGHWQVNRNGKRYYYYRCRASMNGGKSCANKSKIRGEQIESAIVAKIEAEPFSKNFFEKVIAAAMKILETDRLGESVEILAEKIKPLDLQISNMARAIAIAPDVVELAQRMATLNTERQTLQVRLAQSKRSCAPDRADLSRRCRQNAVAAEVWRGCRPLED